MIWRTISALAITILSVAALSGCTLLGRSTYRFELTVEVDTPEGPRRGSSVIEVWASYNMPGSQERLWRVRGEAVAVDLPDGKTLFTLLKTGAIHGDMAGLSMEALDPAFKNDVVESAERIAERKKITSPATVAPASYPTLVTFGDIADPTSVELVDPDNLAATFGEGTALRRITVQITDDPVTTGIEKRLGWLDEVRGALVHIPVSQYPAAGTPLPLYATLTERDFKRGVSR